MQRADLIEPGNRNEATVLRFYTHLMERDIDAFSALWTEDGVQEHVFRFDGLTPALIGRAEIEADYRRMFKNRSGHVFTISALHRTADSDVLIVEARGVSRVGETGTIYDNLYVHVFTLHDGKIANLRFYTNPLVTKKAFDGVLIGKGLSTQREPAPRSGRRADEVEPRNANERTVLGFYVNLMNKDLSAFADLWADDATQEIPFPPEIDGFEPVWKGKAKILSYYNRAIPGRRDHVFHIQALHQTDDPDCLIVEASAHSIVAASARAYDQRYVFVFRLRDGRIVLNREHINPIAFMQAFA